MHRGFAGRRLIIASSITLGVFAAGVVCAQQTPASPDQLQTVVVTAEKRSTSEQDTPISITAVSAEEIATRGLTDFNSLAVSVPGLAMRTSGPGQTEFEMRGLNSSGGNTSMVGFYLDETPLSSPASAQVGKVVMDPNLYDLDHVEILRGPQGTLYGSSSMGGTVKLVPNMPKPGQFDASGETVVSDTTYGGSINLAVNGMVNLPMGDTAALRVVGSSSTTSGWISRNVFADGAVVADGPSFPGAAFPAVSRPANFYTAPLAVSYAGANDTTINGVRATLLWQPTDRLSIVPSVFWQKTDQGSSNTVDVNGSPTNPTTPSTLAHWEIYDTPEPQMDRLTLGSLKAEYQYDSFTVTSATGNWNRHLVVSQDGTEENASALSPGAPYDTAAGGIGPTGPNPYGPGVTERDYTQQFTEELRITSRGDTRFQWLVGYYYQDLSSEWSMYSLNPQLTGLENIYVDFQPQTIIQNAGFADLTFKFTPSLIGNVGARYYSYSLEQHNEEFGIFTVYGGNGLPSSNSTPYYSSASQKASGTDPKFNLSWKVTPDALLYATVSKGFRLGGANQPIPVAPLGNPNSVLVGNECGLQAKLLLIPLSSCSNSNGLLQAPATFASDSVWNYEIGEKAEFMDHRVQLNTSAYYEDWRTPQLATNLAGFGITVNGADAHIYGLESELEALLGAGFQLSANVGYTHSSFQEDSPITGYPEGLAIPDTPKWTGGLVLTNRQPLGNDIEGVGSLEFNYVGSRTTAPYGVTITLLNVNDDLLNMPAYELLNLRYGLRGDHWSATAFVTNVFDKIFLLDPQPQINLQTQAFGRYTVNQPRTVGLDFTYSFKGH
jgi:iron complex outermembrane recepter protein